MRNNALIREDIVSYLETNAGSITDVSSEEIRELNWRGRDFKYPNIRVGNIVQSPNNRDEGPNCSRTSLSFSVLCFDNQESSRRCDIIGYDVSQLFHKKSHTGSNVKFHFFYVTTLQEAIPISDQSWVSQVDVRATIS